ncbi:MAG TPA: nucleoside-diphosphate sugar epimerase/dehydratase, partial [Bacillota bacterium]|nr:nucleoside-diphosphate sugar epimerase/dehydratase [Bacillota bacterium]
MRRKLISAALILMDALIVTIVSYLAFFIRFEGKIDITHNQLMLSSLPLLVLIRIAIFYIFGLYHRLWRYASISELLAITAAVTVSSVLILIVSMMTGRTFPRSIYIISWFLNILFIGASRMCIRVITYLRCTEGQVQQRVLIVGAGDTGYLTARELLLHGNCGKKLVGFIDDDRLKQDQRLLGVKVLGGRKDLKKIVEKMQVDEIIVATPSLTGERLRALIHDCRQTGCRVKMVPALHELINGKPTMEQLREVNLEDLLRREPVKLDLDKVAGYLRGKRVLITGAGGSIGSELCRQVARLQPESLFLLGKGENSIYEIDQELREKYPDLHIQPIIADVRDRRRIRDIFWRTRPEVVFHAAAHKHVPLMELQPEEAVYNNIFGTKVVAEAALMVKTEIFIMISTDKAINPTSVMGATKRVAEQVIQSLNGMGRTKFAAVRFGNVLGSRGSVVPLFQKQIAAGGPVTVTHPEMKRYFMTIPEAVQLVLQAGSMATGGEVFVLDMGEPVKIYDMACALIELSGLRPHTDVEIRFTGLRPGEKLFEELLTAEEGTTATTHQKIFIANLQAVDASKLEDRLNRLVQARSSFEIRKILGELVPTYTGVPESEEFL